MCSVGRMQSIHSDHSTQLLLSADRLRGEERGDELHRLRLAVSNHLQRNEYDALLLGGEGVERLLGDAGLLLALHGLDEHSTQLLGWGDVERLLGGAELLPALHRLDEHSTLLLGWGDVERLRGGAGLLSALCGRDGHSTQLLLSADRLRGEERGDQFLVWRGKAPSSGSRSPSQPPCRRRSRPQGR